MTTSQASEQSIFLAALELPSPAERAAYVKGACGQNQALRSAIEALLAAHERPDNVLDASPAGLAATGEHTPNPRLVATADYQPHGLEPGFVIAGRYILEQKLGEGGMGEVWVAKQSEPVKRKVALKLIKPGMDSRAVLTRFEQERQALAVMDHPNIAKVLDGGMSAVGQPFFVMELVPGLTLTRFCDEAKLGITERLELFVTICQAVQHAHQKGIIHRDLKPSNILVGLVDGRSTPKVIDFGVAKATVGKLTDESLSTQFGAVVGTLEYMPPEQAGLSLADVDTRADIYALGVILYELLTGLRPFDAKRLRQAALDEMIRIIREEEPSKPSTRLSSDASLPSLAASRQSDPHRLPKLLRGDLDSIVMKALEKDRNRRYETANGFAADVQRYLHGEPVLAHPPSAGYRLRKFLNKHRGPVIAAGIVFLVLLGGIIGTTLGLFEAKRQEGIALAEAKRANDEKDRAENEKHRAEDEKKIAQAVRDFLQNRLLGLADVRTQADALLRAGAPVTAASKNRTIRELLDEAAKELTPDRIEENFPNQPLLQAEILQTVGDTYRGVGEFLVAIGFLERSAALRRQKLGAEHLDTLTTLNFLAAAYVAAGQLPEAIRLYEQVREAREKKLGADHPETLSMLNDLGVTYRAAGKFTEAIHLFERMRDLQEQQLGADHPDTLTTLDNLAGSYRAAARLPEAIRLFEQVREAREKRLGADHPSTQTTLSNLALTYYDAGKLTEAILLFEQVRAAHEQKLGTAHPDTLGTLNNLAVAYRAAGKLAEATRIYEQLRETVEKKLGADHPHTLTMLNNLALAYQDAGNLDQALLLFQQAATGIEKRRFQLQGADTLVNNLIACHQQLKQFDQAEAWRRKWLAVVKERDGADSLLYSQELAALSLNLLQQRKWAEAEPVLRECLAIRVKQQPDVWTTFNTQSMLGGALLEQARGASKSGDEEALARAAGWDRDAEPLLLQGYEGMKQRQDKMPPQAKDPRLREALERLVQLYDAWNKPLDAAKWRKELATRLGDQLQKDNTWLLLWSWPRF